jgi:hypothetical protein
MLAIAIVRLDIMRVNYSNALKYPAGLQLASASLERPMQMLQPHPLLLHMVHK